MIISNSDYWKYWSGYLYVIRRYKVLDHKGWGWCGGEDHMEVYKLW